jgi:hypothetical protein
VTNGSGVVQFTFNNFGGCGTLQFGADCESVVFTPSPTIYIASPDNNGTCSVNGVDLTIFAAAYGTSNPCHDFNCSGVVDGIDLTLFATHYGHVCP